LRCGLNALADVRQVSMLRHAIALVCLRKVLIPEFLQTALAPLVPCRHSTAKGVSRSELFNLGAGIRATIAVKGGGHHLVGVREVTTRGTIYRARTRSTSPFRQASRARCRSPRTNGIFIRRESGQDAHMSPATTPGLTAEQSAMGLLVERANRHAADVHQDGQRPPGGRHIWRASPRR
jgi:hypothetical protein